VIANGEHHVIGRLTDHHLDRLLILGILDGVVDEVQQSPRDRLAIPHLGFQSFFDERGDREALAANP
jgi:hypothetical protein